MWCAIHFPALAIDLVERGQAATEPFAIAIVTGHGVSARIYACNALATQSGIHPGLVLTAALALEPALHCITHDPTAEQHALTQLADWAGQFSSLVSLVTPTGLVIEIGRSLALFGAADALLDTMRNGVAALGFQCAIAHAPTPLAAIWFARAAAISDASHNQTWQKRLRHLPLGVIDEASDALHVLRKMGLCTVGDVLRLPRAELSRRIGPQLLCALDRASGHLADPREAYVAPAHFRQHIDLLAPVSSTDALLFALRRLFIALEGFLRARQSGVSAVMIVLAHDGQAPTQQRLGFQKNSRSVTIWQDVAREWVARLSFPAPVTSLTLEAEDYAPLAAQQCDALTSTAAPPDDLSALLLARLHARLGRDAVHSVRCVSEHRPEYAWQRCAASFRNNASADDAESSSTSPIDTLDRPLWLLPQPTPLSLVAQRLWHDGELSLQGGPERIESGWWDDRDVRRDYFVASNARGERLWIFRTLDSPPQWFLHGFFG